MLTGMDSRVDATASGSAVFLFEFRTLNADHIEVFTRATVNDLWGDPLTTGYTVHLNADQELDAGGDVTFDVAPAVGVLVRVQRTVPLTQETDLPPYSEFPARTVETTFDRVEMQIQQLDRQADDLDSRVFVVETTDVTQNTRLTSLETADTAQDGRLTALEAQDVTDDARMDAIEASIAALVTPWSVMLSFLGPVTQDEVLAQFVVAEAVTLGAGTRAKAAVAPTVGAEITVWQNGVVLGTLTWAAGQTEAVSTVTGAVAPGDLLILTVSAADATISDVSITLKGTR